MGHTRQDNVLMGAQPAGFLDDLKGISDRKRHTLTLAHEYMVPNRISRSGVSPARWT